MDYLWLGPPDGDAPAVLALPPAPQSRQRAQEVAAVWGEAMLEDGFALVVPVAPVEGLFSGAVAYERLPPLMDHVARVSGVRDWHLLGVSDGGRGALSLGAAFAARFDSVTVVPGATSSLEALGALLRTRVTVVVGSEDAGWLESSRRVDRWLRRAGGQSALVELAGEGHDAFRRVDWPTLRSWMTSPVDGRRDRS